MRAFLIEPREMRVRVVEHDGTLEGIYKLLGVDAIDATRFGEEGDAIYVDDYGLFKAEDGRLGVNDWFCVRGNPNALVGKGLVVGADSEGNDIEPRASLAWAIANVHWIQPVQTGSGVQFIPRRGRVH